MGKHSKKFIRSSPKTDSLVGTKIHRWTVLEKIRAGKITKFKVKCDCGTEKIIHHVTLKVSKSCGCLQKEINIKRCIKPNNQAAIRKLYNGYLSGAKERNLVFELTLNETLTLALQNCFYCNKSPSRNIITKGGNIKANGIDRVDNDVGYVLTNCVSCCKECNNLKRSVTKTIIEKAYEFFKKS